MEKLQNLESKENNENTPSIRMEFFRHDEKGEIPEGMGKNDIRITKDGRVHAEEVGEGRNPHPEVGLTYGSPRARSGETAYHQLLGGQEEITPELTLEEIEEVIKQEVKVGGKKIKTPLLNFDWRGKFNDEASKYFNDGKVMEFMLNESDDLIRKYKDTESTGYSKSAANVAELIQKYIKILPRWEQIIAKDEEKKYEEFKNELQRFLGSHGSVLESFLLKLIEKTESHEAARNSIGELINNGGFDYSEGFTLQMQKTDNGKVEINIKYKDREWNISPEVIQNIIEDAKKLNEEVVGEEE